MASKKAQKTEKQKRYFLVNPHGAVHECTREHLEWRLMNFAGYRVATAAEIKRYLNERVQTHEQPFGKAFSVDDIEGVYIEDEAEPEPDKKAKHDKKADKE